MSSLPRERSGAASGTLATARLFGQTIGAAVVAVLFTAAAGSIGLAVPVALWIAAGMTLAGAVFSLSRRSGVPEDRAPAPLRT